MSRYLKVGLESTFGTAATTLVGVRATEINHSVDHNIVYLESIDGWSPYDGVIGAHSVKFTFIAYAIKDQINPILNAALGKETDVSDGTTTTGYKYSYDYPKSLTCEYGDRHGNAYQLLGVVPNQIKIDAKAKSVLTLEADCIAKSVSTTTFAEPTYSSDLPFVCFKTSVTFGGTAVPVKEVSLTINRNIDQDAFVLDSTTLHGIYAGELNANGTITVLEDNTSEFLRALFGDPSASSLADVPAKVDVVITAKTPDGSKGMTITMPSVLYPSGDTRIRGKSTAEKTINFRALSDELTIEVDA